MAKQSGLGDNFYVGGFDLSGDIQSLGRIGGGPAALDVTAINASAFERLGGKRDGVLEFVSFFNAASGQAHPTLSDLPTSDVIVSYFRGTTLGSPAASLIGKQVNYDGNRDADGNLTFNVQALSNGFGIEWGHQLTAGIEQHTSTGDGTGVDFTAGQSFGLQAYLHVFDFDGTDVTIAVQDSDDDAATDPYTDVTGAVFTQVTAAPYSERIQTGRTQAVKRWLRVNCTGTFTTVDFAVVVVVNRAAVSF